MTRLESILMIVEARLELEMREVREQAPRAVDSMGKMHQMGGYLAGLEYALEVVREEGGLSPGEEHPTGESPKLAE